MAARAVKIILASILSIPPFSPGRVWHRLQYLLGLQEMGHDVYFVEDLRAGMCVDEQGQPTDLAHSANVRLLQQALAPFGLAARACQLYEGGEQTFGLSLAELVALTKETDLLINWSGHASTDFLLGNVRARMYLDQDPVFTQLWHAVDGHDMNLRGHDWYFSVGLNIGTPHCTVPDCGVRWHHLLPPVVLAQWASAGQPVGRRYTTLATLSSFGSVTYRGESYGSKIEEFQKLAPLPSMVDVELEVAMKYYEAEASTRKLLGAHGWRSIDAADIADLAGYQRYIAGSRGEIGVAQNAYVKSCSGWFSDRWSHYLASGRPVLAQATGFERSLPTGEGLLAFRDVDEAAEGIRRLERDYEAHCMAARAFAAEHLDHRRVLSTMLEICRS